MFSSSIGSIARHDGLNSSVAVDDLRLSRKMHRNSRRAGSLGSPMFPFFLIGLMFLFWVVVMPADEPAAEEGAGATCWRT